MSLFLLDSEAVGAQQRSDHVDRDGERGGAVDQLHDHGQIRLRPAA
jgi:hypothetical protein